MYKRQVQCTAAQKGAVQLVAKDVGFISDDSGKPTEDTDTHMAVSYTHLDVYKRQRSYVSQMAGMLLKSRCGSTPWLYIFMARVMASTLPVLSLIHI